VIRVNDDIAIDERDVDERFVRASGPGGQNVNKVATAVELRFDIRASSLPADVKERLTALAGARLTGDGVLLIDSREHRTQVQNREAALTRLLALVRQAAKRPKKRRKTRPPAAAGEARLRLKRNRGQIKAGRGQHARGRGKDDE
jgi:ribosome-associated protein